MLTWTSAKCSRKRLLFFSDIGALRLWELSYPCGRILPIIGNALVEDPKAVGVPIEDKYSTIRGVAKDKRAAAKEVAAEDQQVGPTAGAAPRGAPDRGDQGGHPGQGSSSSESTPLASPFGFAIEM